MKPTCLDFTSQPEPASRSHSASFSLSEKKLGMDILPAELLDSILLFATYKDYSALRALFVVARAFSRACAHCRTDDYLCDEDHTC